MIHVKIYDYQDINEINRVKVWLDDQHPKVKAKLNTRLNNLEQISRSEWRTLNTEVLSGDKDGLISIRVEYQGVQYRLIGYDGPNRGEFTILGCCTEQNNKYRPLNIGRTCFDRIKEIDKNPDSRRVSHDYR